MEMYRYDHNIITLWAMDNPQNPPAKSNNRFVRSRALWVARVRFR
jgi:hypothetical protein